MAPDAHTPNGTYLAIGLKSFHASVECADRGLDPFATDLVVADPTRSPNTICLAVTPSLKAKGVRNRCRIREIPQGIPYITAMPRMHRYMEVSAQVYAIYLRYVSSQDAWPYSVDEAFLDVTPYRAPYDSNARELAHRITSEVREETGVPATAGIGPNMFLCKVAPWGVWPQRRVAHRSRLGARALYHRGRAGLRAQGTIALQRPGAHARLRL
jgi:DNA polymerase V